MIGVNEMCEEIVLSSDVDVERSISKNNCLCYMAGMYCYSDVVGHELVSAGEIISNSVLARADSVITLKQATLNVSTALSDFHWLAGMQNAECVAGILAEFKVCEISIDSVVARELVSKCNFIVRAVSKSLVSGEHAAKQIAQLVTVIKSEYSTAG